MHSLAKSCPRIGVEGHDMASCVGSRDRVFVGQFCSFPYFLCFEKNKNEA